MPFHVGPFGGKDAVDHCVTDRSITPGVVVANHAVLLGAKRRDRFLGNEVEVVRSKPDDPARHGLERVAEQQQFAGGVDMTALASRGVPGVADLHPIDPGNDIVVPRAPHDLAGLELAHRPRQHMTCLMTLERVGDVAGSLLGLRNGGEPELPKAAVGSGGGQPFPMRGGQGLEPDAVALECDGSKSDHERPPEGDGSTSRMMMVDNIVAMSARSLPVTAKTSAKQAVSVRPGRSTRPAARKLSPRAGASKLILN